MLFMLKNGVDRDKCFIWIYQLQRLFLQFIVTFLFDKFFQISDM